MKKMVGWSFPTSPNAKRFGFYNEGCWHVELGIDYIAGFATPEEALIFAYMIDAEWDPMFIKYMASAVLKVFE